MSPVRYWVLIAIALTALVTTKLLARAGLLRLNSFVKLTATTDQICTEFEQEYRDWIKSVMQDPACLAKPNRLSGLRGPSSTSLRDPDYYRMANTASEQYNGEEPDRVAFTWRVTCEAGFLRTQPVTIEAGLGYRTEDFVRRLTKAYEADGISYRVVDVRDKSYDDVLSDMGWVTATLVSGLTAMHALAGMASILGAIVSVAVPMVRQWPRQGTTPHCRPCGYNLTGLTTPRCPECGSAITPATTVRGSRRITPEFWAARVAWTVAWVVCYWAWKSIWW